MFSDNFDNFDNSANWYFYPQKGEFELSFYPISKKGSIGSTNLNKIIRVAGCKNRPIQLKYAKNIFGGVGGVVGVVKTIAGTPIHGINMQHLAKTIIEQGGKRQNRQTRVFICYFSSYLKS